jgi:RimJ/RimL family protein N-acetyltransferase
MTQVSLRPVAADDLPLLPAAGPADDPFGYFGFVATNSLQRTFAETGLISDAFGLLIVEEVADTAEVAGYVGWAQEQNGPSATARCLNVGIYLRPAFRGRGIGSVAQDVFARYLFDTTLYERLSAGTDVENVAEQIALERAGFTREGVARHAQYRAGTWHDLVMYSRLRGDHPAV